MSSSAAGQFRGYLSCKKLGHQRLIGQLCHGWRSLVSPVPKSRKEHVDGHERPAVKYRRGVFLPAFGEIRPFLVTWGEEGYMNMSQPPPRPEASGSCCS